MLSTELSICTAEGETDTVRAPQTREAPQGWPPEGDTLGWVHSAETAGMADGPGIRYVLFLTGCMLRCLYCQNPDTWHMHDGRPRMASDVVREIARYAPFLRRHGGVTISGGEPLCQVEFVRAVLRGCKALGLHTALDTNGYLGSHADDEMLADVDLVLLDIKEWNRESYRKLTGVALEPTLAFADRLARLRRPVWLRYVLVPGLTDDLDHIAGLAAYAASLDNVERVDVLPFHKMGEYKWRELEIPYTLGDTPVPQPELVEIVRGFFRRRGLNVPAGRGMKVA